MDLTLLRGRVSDDANRLIVSSHALGDAVGVERLADDLKQRGPGIEGEAYHVLILDELTKRARAIRRSSP